MVDRTVNPLAVSSFFSLGAGLKNRLGICRGLSCELHGAAELDARIRAPGSPVAIQCLGQCHDSPALWLPDGSVVAGADALQWPAMAGAAGTPQAVDVRVVARRAVVTERIGNGCFAGIDRARDAGVYASFVAALDKAPEAVLEAVVASGERGRGGAAFATGEKWRRCALAAGARRYVVANGDEGDPGSFIDRVLLEDDPHAVLEGLALSAFAVGATQGMVFVRAEYPLARARINQAIIEAREAGLLGTAILGSSFSFDVHLVAGHGSYVCGEETALLNAIEGRRGEVRVRPPYPATTGLHGFPTVVNNIETLVNIPWILREGPAAFRALGTAGSPGTKAFCLNRGFDRPGIVEAEFGVSLREIVEIHGGGPRGGGPWHGVALGGPMGSVLGRSDLDTPVDYAELARRGIRLGHGGIVMLPQSADLGEVLVAWATFMASESCGKCAPCAIGSAQVLRLARQMARPAEAPAAAKTELMRLLDVIESASLCGFGQGIPAPLRTLARMASQSPTGLEACRDGRDTRTD